MSSISNSNEWGSKLSKDQSDLGLYKPYMTDKKQKIDSLKTSEQKSISRLKNNPTAIMKSPPNQSSRLLSNGSRIDAGDSINPLADKEKEISKLDLDCFKNLHKTLKKAFPTHDLTFFENIFTLIENQEVDARSEAFIDDINEKLIDCYFSLSPSYDEEDFEEQFQTENIIKKVLVNSTIYFIELETLLHKMPIESSSIPDALLRKVENESVAHTANNFNSTYLDLDLEGNFTNEEFISKNLKLHEQSRSLQLAHLEVDPKNWTVA